jgi:nucleoside-diphosphate-sugar epimerase
MGDLHRCILITGGSGFLGSYLASGLHASGARVVVFDRAPPSQHARFIAREVWPYVAFVQGDVTILADILDAAQRHHAEGIVHLAAQQDIEFADEHPLATYHTNVLGTLNVLETVRLLELGRTVIGSSMAALAVPRSLPVTETSATFDPTAGHPTGHYGASKAAAEMIALAYHSVYGSDVVVLRFPSIYGLGSPHRAYVGPAIEAALRGESITFTAGEGAQRDYLYVKDAVSGILRALTSPPEALVQRLFLIATGRLSTAANVAHIVQELVPGVRVAVGPGQTPLEARVASIRVQYDVSRARTMLGFVPEYELRAGIADYVATYRQYLRSLRDTGPAVDT